jgi:hypothetical protein
MEMKRLAVPFKESVQPLKQRNINNTGTEELLGVGFRLNITLQAMLSTGVKATAESALNLAQYIAGVAVLQECGRH